MTYTLIKQNLINEDMNRYDTYGIAGNDGICIVQDISQDINFVNSIVNALNEHEVSVLHVKDIVEDALFEYEERTTHEQF